MNRTIRSLALAGLLLVFPVPCLADGAPLMCQLRAQELSGPFVPVSVSFTALVAEGTPPYSVQWAFGDGSTGAGMSAQHTYTQTAFRTAIMTVTDASPVPQTCADSTLLHPGFAVDPACIANASTRWAPVPLLVNFRAEPVFAPPDPLEWIWSFGDGATSTQWAPLHVFTAPGTYWVALQMLKLPYVADCLPVVRITALPSDPLGVPTDPSHRLALRAPRPNPSDREATFPFELPRAGHVRIEIVDLAGRTVATLVDAERDAGPQSTVWRGRSSAGRIATAGLYFARLTHAGETRSVAVVRLP